MWLNKLKNFPQSLLEGLFNNLFRKVAFKKTRTHVS